MVWDKVVKYLALVGGMIAGMFGEWTMLLTCLAVVMVTDYVTGVIVAWCGKSPKTESGGVSSKAGFIGLMKKAMIMFIVLVATILDQALGMNTMAFQTAAVCYYLANESLSILENAALLGVPFPPKIRDALEALKMREDKPPDIMGDD